MNCAAGSVRMPVIRWRVVCGFFDVMLMRAPTSAFSSVDLPTEGRPTIATWPARCAASSAIATRFRQQIERLCRGLLLGGTAACAGAARRDPEVGDPALDDECLRVRLAGRRDDLVDWLGQPPLVQRFLQPRFRILAEARRI